MDEDKLNMQVRKFLKKVGIQSQREIERAVNDLAERGELPDGRPVRAVVTLSVEALGVDERIEGDIDF